MRYPTPLLAAAALVGGVLSPLGAAAVAHADTAKPTWSYDFRTPGTYHLTVPSLADGVAGLRVAGASGGDGASSLDAGYGSTSVGGTGGAGADVRASLSVGTTASDTFRPGEHLTIVIGRRGAGSNQGDGAGGGTGGDLVGGDGGAGGGASWIVDQDRNVIVALAGGGGGGGGGGAGTPRVSDSAKGGDGGGAVGSLNGDGETGELSGSRGGTGGTGGDTRVCGPAGITHGGILGLTAGESANLFFAAGGGGGGGGGDCGGQGGKSGDDGSFGNGGGGGGSAGGSIYGTGWHADSVPVFVFDNTGSDGRVTLAFQVDANPYGQATFTSGDAMTIPADAVSGTFQVTAVADPSLPGPTYSLVGAPSWVSIDPKSGQLTASGFRAAGVAGTYSFTILAHVGDTATPQTFTVTVDTAPQYPPTTRQLGTIRTGQTASWQYAVPSYPAPTYSLGGAPSWLTINPHTGVVTAKPLAGAAGTYGFYVFAADGVDPMTNRYSTLTVVPGPTPHVTSLSTTRIGQGAVHTETVRGSGFVAGATVGLGNSRLHVASVKVANPTTITFTLSAAINATPGTYAVRVTNPDHSTGQRANALQVDARPAIRSVTQLRRIRAHATTLVVRGLAFQRGVRVAVGGAGVVVKAVKRLSASRLKVTLRVGAKAVHGRRMVTVTNPDGGRAVKAHAIRLRTR